MQVITLFQLVLVHQSAHHERSAQCMRALLVSEARTRLDHLSVSFSFSKAGSTHTTALLWRRVATSRNQCKITIKTPPKRMENKERPVVIAKI